MNRTYDQLNDNSTARATDELVVEIGSLYKYYGEVEDGQKNRGKQYSLALILTSTTL